MMRIERKSVLNVQIKKYATILLYTTPHSKIITVFDNVQISIIIRNFKETILYLNIITIIPIELISDWTNSS